MRPGHAFTRNARPRHAVEADHGRNCVASLPSGLPAERLDTPWGTSVLVLTDPTPVGLGRLAARDGHAGIRFWLSPCGDHAIAWTAGDVAHFQIYCDLIDEGWHQGRIEPGCGNVPAITVQDHVAEILLDGKAGVRMAGGRYRVHTSLRSLDSRAHAPGASASP